MVLAGFVVPTVVWAEPAQLYTIDAPQRLSQWMYQHHETADWYSLRMGWSTPEEKKYQTVFIIKPKVCLKQALKR